MLLGEVFVYLDDVQYTKKDWRNRNRLISPAGVKNVFIPVSNGSRNILINEAEVSYDQPWQNKLYNQVLNWYKKAPYFDQVISILEPLFNASNKLLVDYNYELNERILNYLGHDTKIVLSSSIPSSTDDKNRRIIEICKAMNGTLLYDGKSAEDFIDREAFTSEGIALEFQNFNHTPYKQLNESFEPFVSIIDLLMMVGPSAKEVILSNTNIQNSRLHERREHVSSLPIQ